MGARSKKPQPNNLKFWTLPAALTREEDQRMKGIVSSGVLVAILCLLSSMCGCSGGNNGGKDSGGGGTQPPPSTAIQSITVSCAGSSCSVETGSTLQLLDTVTCVSDGHCDAAVTWYVCTGTVSAPANCVVNGNSTLGTIDNNGLYAAPESVLPNGGIVIVKAVGSDNFTFGAASVLSTVVLTDNQLYTKGSYDAYMQPWGKGSLVAGKDYTESFTVTPYTFPDNSTITWSWPNTPAYSTTGSGVYNYLAFGYGEGAQVPITPKKLADIQALSETHDFALSGSLPGFDVIHDIMLTSVPNGPWDGTQIEVEIFLHTPAYSVSFAQAATQVGTFTGSGRTWAVSVYLNTAGTAGDVVIVPQNYEDVPSGTVDIKAMFDYLVSQKVLTGNEYFNGLQTGVEVDQGNGSAAFKSYSVSYE